MRFASSWVQLLGHFLYSAASRTRSAPHIRDATSVQGVLNRFVVATIPCWLIGLWSLGHQSNLVMIELGVTSLPGWRGIWLNVLGIGHDPGSIGACFFFGLVHFVPVFLVALVVGSIWEALFSAVRHRPTGEGLLAFAWLFALGLPAGVELYQVALGATFGFVVGGAIYGGSGRYLVNPALLGLIFLLFAYPTLVFGPENWIPVTDSVSLPPLKLAAAGGVQAVQEAGYTWWGLFLGMRPGPFGALSVFGCVIGAMYLVLAGCVSWRILLGALLGLVGTVLLFNGLAASASPGAAVPWTWHLVLGGFAFGAVFFATDPVPAATTQAGRWVFGVLVGVLTVVIRISNPSYNEGVLFAVLLASLFSPVIDFVVVELNIRRRRRRLTEINGA